MESTTRDQSTHIYKESIVSDSFKQNLKTYLLNPLSAGLVGFAILFSLILITKIIGFVIGTNETFNLSVNDVIYSLVGFLFVTGSKFLEFFGKEE